uniref:RING-type E3 ubiquitin transferase n=1 Tax=Cacopsylla melanoneura TaxID=428564 RepID=A0A8D8ZYF1_9HEMI
MSRHEGVSCDSCLKGNFRGRRYKCLVCYDYDLCGACYDAGATTTRHTTEHPMQCILTRNDLELYYEGEGLEQQQSFTCPFCGKMGFTESALHEHVTADHTVSTFEVVCPICAAQPGGDPNLITDDFASHLSLEHRSGPRDLISFLDEPSGSRHSVRRIPHPTRGVGSSRNRNRSNMHFSSSGNATSSLSTRDTVDPIAELLSQLSGVRRSTGSNSSTSQLAHIQMQLQLERQQVRAARQQLERLPRRQNQASTSGANHASSASTNSHSNALGTGNSDSTAAVGQGKQYDFLLSKTLSEHVSESDKQKQEQEKLRRLVYIHSVLLGSLRAGVKLGSNPDLEPLLPQLKLLSLSESDAMGVTNISVGGSQGAGPSQNGGGAKVASPSNSAVPIKTGSTPTPLTRTISIATPTTSSTSQSATRTNHVRQLLAKKLVTITRPTGVGTIRQMVAAQAKEKRQQDLASKPDEIKPSVVTH